MNQGLDSSGDARPNHAPVVGFLQRFSVRHGVQAILAALALGLVFSAVQIVDDFARIEARIDKQVEQAVEISRGPAQAAALHGDGELAEQIAESVMSHRAVGRVELKAEGGGVLADIRRSAGEGVGTSAFAEYLFGPDRLFANRLHDPDGKVIGELAITIDTAWLTRDFLERSGRTVVGTLLLSLSLAALLSLMFFFGLVRPMLETAKRIWEMDPPGSESGALAAPQGRRSGEVALLIRAIEGLRVRFADAIGERDQEIAERRIAEVALRRSERNFAAAQRIAQLGSYEWDIGRDLLTWTDQTYRLFGVEKESFQPTVEGFEAFVHPDDLPRVRALTKAAMQFNAPYDITFRIRRPDGEERILYEQAELDFDPQGKPLIMRGAIYDITERRAAEDKIRKLNDELERRVEQRTAELRRVNLELTREIEERQNAEDSLRDSEQRFQDIADSASDWFWETGPDRRLTYLSERLREVTGIDPSSSIGLKFEDLTSTDHESSDYHAILEALHARRSFRGLVYHRRLEDGSVVSLESSGKPIFDDDGEFSGFRGATTDVTERIRAQAALAAAQETLLRKTRLAALGELTATVAHELRNPLGAVASSAHVIRRKSDKNDADVTRALNLADRGIRRCDAIITELLDFTRAKGLQPLPYEIDSWLPKMLDELDFPEAVTVERDLGADGTIASFDAEALRRAIINVVENAKEAVMVQEHEKDKVARGRLLIKTRPCSEKVDIQVGDNGPGIPKGQLDKIMEPLFSTKSFGTGLGLPTVQRILEDHGGGVEIESEEGRGTTVTLWLRPNGRNDRPLQP
jgi:PAS domain S-box-containing protein